LGAVDPSGAAGVFQEARIICQRDAGKLWGHTLCGPILLVDPEDRSIAASQAGGGVLRGNGGIFTGLLPASEILANTSVQWSGTLWSEMLWPLPDDAAKRHVMIAHELFHRIQPELKMVRRDGDNRHLNTLEGRYLLQLEWRALAKALNAPTGAARKTAIGDAVLFRQERYRLFEQAASEERALELNEGVAEYTGVKLGLTTRKQRVAFAIYDLGAFVAAPTFVRSFAYATGPAYGLLLDQADPAWREKLGSDRRLDELLSSALKLPAPTFATLHAREAIYDDDGALRTGELKRDTETRARLAALKSKFIDGAVLTLPLEHSSYQFNPQTLVPLGDAGTVYPTLRLSAEWGVLEVQDGALLDQAKSLASVSAVGMDLASGTGRGWKLALKSGWSIQPGMRPGDYVVRPHAPSG
jgi:hypothetical protein